MVINYTKKGEEFKQKNKHFKLNPVFEKATGRQMLFACLYADPDSPLASFKYRFELADNPDYEFRKLIITRMEWFRKSETRKSIMEGKHQMVEMLIKEMRLLVPNTDMRSYYMKIRQEHHAEMGLPDYKHTKKQALLYEFATNKLRVLARARPVKEAPKTAGEVKEIQKKEAMKEMDINE